MNRQKSKKLTLGLSRILRLFLTGFLLVLLIPLSSARAATFTVTNVSEFQTALDEAAANGENDTINVTTGTYNLTTTLTFWSSENFSLTIIGAGGDSTILDGGNSTQILNLETTANNADLIVKGIRFQNGSASEGGALRIETSSAAITIENSEFNDNSVTTLGGGVNAISNTGIISVSNCSFRRNSAVDDAGGLNVGTTDGVILLTNSIFEDNTVPGVHPGVPAKDGGGAILYVDGSGQISMTDNTFLGNTAADGAGGCMTYLLGSGVSVTINNNSFSNNRAQLDGGGCFTRINDNGTITYNNNTFTGNSTVTAGGAGSMIHLNAGNLIYSGNTYTNNASAEDGGGTWIWNGTGTLNISSNTFTGNEAAINGGGAFLSTDQGTVTVSKNVFDANTAGNVGGGLSYSTNNGQLNLSNNTFYGNGASEGGGGYFYFDQSGAQTSILNNIFWHDTPQAISMSGATSATATYSDIEGGTGQSWFGTGCIDSDPLFADPAGGDFHLTWANFPVADSTRSPCIDAGDPASPLDPDSTVTDMGAFYFDQTSGVKDDHSGWTKGYFRLYQNYPNPFNSSTTIRYSLSRPSWVEIHIYNVNGQLVRTLANDYKGVGDYAVVWDAEGIRSGVYFCRLKTSGYQATKKIELIR